MKFQMKISSRRGGWAAPWRALRVDDAVSVSVAVEVRVAAAGERDFLQLPKCNAIKECGGTVAWWYGNMAAR